MTYNDTAERLALAPVVCGASATVNGVTIDRRGTPYFRGLTFVVTSGVITDGTHTLVIQESANGSSWTNVANSNLVGVANSTALTGSSVTTASYTGSQPYVRVAVVSAGVTVGGLFSAIVILSDPRHGPAR